MKLSHKSVGFEHPAKGENHCADCTHWQGKIGQCSIVRPPVRAGDWCERFKEKKGEEKY
jgi:hypothetical protein